jgi:anaerobic ribonucleoside-triphosphate reductase activating protein
MLALTRRVRAQFPEMSIWCYTGYTLEQDILPGHLGDPEVTAQLLQNLDVLVDGEFHLAEKNPGLRFRGSENQRLLDVKKTLAAGEAVLWDGREEP